MGSSFRGRRPEELRGRDAARRARGDRAGYLKLPGGRLTADSGYQGVPTSPGRTAHRQDSSFSCGVGGRRPMLTNPHYSRMEPANNASLRETFVLGVPGWTTRRQSTGTLHGVRPSRSILPLQQGILTGQVSLDYSRSHPAGRAKWLCRTGGDVGSTSARPTRASPAPPCSCARRDQCPPQRGSGIPIDTALHAELVRRWAALGACPVRRYVAHPGFVCQGESTPPVLARTIRS